MRSGERKKLGRPPAEEHSPFTGETGHRMLPQVPEAERALICCALLAPEDVLDEAEAKVPAGFFHVPAHAIVWEHLVAMRKERQAIDMVTLTSRLRAAGALDEVGGPAAIAGLYSFLPSVGNWRRYADDVSEAYVARMVIRICGESRERSFSDRLEIKDLLEDTITQLVDLAAARAGEETSRPVKAFVKQALDEIEYTYRNRGKTIGLPTGFADLDRMIGGWQAGLTYYFGARPAMGKSSLGLNFAAAVSAHTLQQGAPVMFFSLEMTGAQLAKRLICSLAEINLQRARDGFLSIERDWETLQRSALEVARSRLHIDETAALTIADFRARVRRFVKHVRRSRPPETVGEDGRRKDGKPDALVIIDYLQRMKGSSKRSEDARYLELQEIAQGISQTAKELQVPIIVLAQLKRPKDKKPDTEPDMSEFRECGDIEQEAHVVALIHRPHYYVKHNTEKQQALAEELQERFRKEAVWKGMSREEAEGTIIFSAEDLERYAKLIIDKQREGPVGPVDLRFIADYTRFETWDPNRERYSNNAAHRQVRQEEVEG